MAAACNRSPRAALDAAADEYVRLARAGDRHDSAVLGEIAAARRRVAGLPEIDGRRAFLLAQLSALERRARFLRGERRSIRDEAAALGLAIPAYDEARAASLRNELDAALPGSGGLATRLAAHRRAAALPRAQLDAAATRAMAECRTRVPAANLRADAGIELRYVLEQPWLAFTTYQDDGRSLVEIRRDAAWLHDDLLAVMCHETYPGHHLQNLVWADLQRSRGWNELSVKPMFTPHAVMAERSACAATALTVPAATRPRVSVIMDGLAPLALATAIAAVDGDIGRSAARDRLRDDLLMPDPDGFLSFVERYRSMAVAYVTPAEGIGDWESYLALLSSPARLVAGAAQ